MRITSSKNDAKCEECFDFGYSSVALNAISFNKYCA